MIGSTYGAVTTKGTPAAGIALQTLEDPALPRSVDDPAFRRFTEPSDLTGTADLADVAGSELVRQRSPRGEQALTRGEQALTGGRLVDGVVRVGGTVRKPAQPQSIAVAHYLDHLHRVGFAAAPRFLGRDGRGRDVLSYLEGDVPGDPLPAWAASDELLVSVAMLVRRLHVASTGFCTDRGFAAPPGTVWRRDLVKVDLPDPEPTPELISHLDMVPSNVVVRGGRAVGLIDFDLSGPTTHLLNLYTTAAHWVPLCPPEDIPPAWRGVDQARRLRLFADGYGLPARDRLTLPDFGIARADITYRRMKASAEQLGGGWARMWEGGAGDVILRRKAWLSSVRDDLLAALR